MAEMENGSAAGRKMKEKKPQKIRLTLRDSEASPSS